MATWNKKDVSKEMIRELMDKYNIDSLTASILLRRNIKSGEDIQYFLENDKRFLHNPFLFSNMEDAVDRILQAQEEGEIVLNACLFGDIIRKLPSDLVNIEVIDGVTYIDGILIVNKTYSLPQDYMPSNSSGYNRCNECLSKETLSAFNEMKADWKEFSKQEDYLYNGNIEGQGI